MSDVCRILTSPDPCAYRADLNGLRALAVAAVVLFHFQFPGLGGGFVGVDIFFVLSGFLMTRIILSALQMGRFSWQQFYLARARRIVPALLVLCLVLLFLGWWWLPAADYRLLATHAASALGFISNLRFLKEAGYFDAASHDKWLLHTWSLAVEWQFYLLLPLLLLLLWRLWGLRGCVRGLALLAVISFLWSVYATAHWPASAFYLLGSRAWELVAGGLTWYLSSRVHLSDRWCRFGEWGGLGLIVLAIAGCNGDTPWPGSMAALPVLGTMLVLLVARTDSRLLGHPLAQWLGRCSYSIYLWHWPLVVLLAYGNLQSSTLAVAAALLGTLLLGALSYRFVETPGRVWLGQLPSRRCGWVLLSGVLLVAAPALAIRKLELTGRVNVQVEAAARDQLNENPRRKECLPGSGDQFPVCHFGGEKLDAILLGDSHAMALSSAMTAAQADRQRGFTLLAYSSCPSVNQAKRFGPGIDERHQCARFNAHAQDYLQKQPPAVPVVVINRGSLYPLGDMQAEDQGPVVYFERRYEDPDPVFLADYRERLVQSSCQLAKSRPVFLMRPIPEMPVEVAKRITRDRMWGRPSVAVSISLAEYHARHRFIWDAQDEAVRRCGVAILNPLPYLCDGDRCWGTRDGRALYYDKDHLSEYGNKLLVPLFRQVLAAHSRPVSLISSAQASIPWQAGTSG